MLDILFTPITPVKSLKRYLAKRREIRNTLTLLSYSGAVRQSTEEVRWGRRGPFRNGKEIRTVVRSRS